MHDTYLLTYAALCYVKVKTKEVSNALTV